MSNNKSILFIVLFVALTAMRFVYLEQDAPAYMIGGVCQEDEIYYVHGAVNRYNIDNNRTISGFEKIRSEGLMLYGTHLVYLSLKVFGNNYWGIRIPVVLVSLLIILLLNSILNILKIDKRIRYLALFYLFTDFYFFLFSRYQTPQIFSILGITLVLWLYFKYGLEKFKGPFLIGVFCFITVGFVYVYNLFLIMAFGLLVLNVSFKQRSIKPVLMYSLGIVTGFALYIVALSAVGSSIMDIIHTLSNHGGGIEAGSKTVTSTGFISVLKHAYEKLIQLPLTNLFRYNLGILIMFLLTLPFVFYTAFKAGSQRHLLYILFLGAMMLQSFFVVSYPFKKLIVVLPLVVLVLADCFISSLQFYKEISKNKKVLLMGYLMLSFYLAYVNFKVNNSPGYWSSFGYGYYDNTPQWFNLTNFAIMILVILMFTVYIFSFWEKARLFFIVPAFLGIILTVYVCFISKTFYARDGFTKASTYLNGKGVLTDACYASQLYTTCTPALGCYGDKVNLGSRYYPLADSLFKCGLGDYRIVKVMPSQEKEMRTDSNFTEVERIPMKYYTYYVYKYNR